MMRKQICLALALLATPTFAAEVRLPPSGAQYDSQLGGAYRPPAGTQVISRDREDAPARGLYNVCYVNAFQTQPQDSKWWRQNHPDLLLSKNGRLVEDPNWPGEYLLDTTSPAKRQALLAIVGKWINGCAQDGFDAIEADNLDTYSRSNGAISIADNLAFAHDFVAIAHGLGLAAAQKNGVDLGRRGRSAGFDFAITESCEVYDECGTYKSVFGAQVYDIEYTDTARAHFDHLCATPGRNFSVTLRDRNLTSPAHPSYIYEAC